MAEECSSTLGHLQADGFTGEEMKRAYAPIGLDLGGNSPQEIAVGILAEVIACRQKKGIAEHHVSTRRIHWPENN